MITNVKRVVQARSGSGAVEFALISPLFIMFLFGIVAYSTIFTVSSGMQQLAAESARASLAGLTDTERTQLAQTFVASNSSAYPFLDPQKLTISATINYKPSKQLQVSLSYDMSKAPMFSLAGVPLPMSQLQRTAIVDLSGTT